MVVVNQQHLVCHDQIRIIARMRSVEGQRILSHRTGRGVVQPRLEACSLSYIACRTACQR